jgi:hypothetical protein
MGTDEEELLKAWFNSLHPLAGAPKRDAKRRVNARTDGLFFIRAHPCHPWFFLLSVANSS